jgi:hypothetical protein
VPTVDLQTDQMSFPFSFASSCYLCGPAVVNSIGCHHLSPHPLLATLASKVVSSPQRIGQRSAPTHFAATLATTILVLAARPTIGERLKLPFVSNQRVPVVTVWACFFNAVFQS